MQVADKVFGFTLWKEQVNLSDVWMSYPLHPLQEQEPAGDRQWIEHFPVLQVNKKTFSRKFHYTVPVKF